MSSSRGSSYNGRICRGSPIRLQRGGAVIALAVAAVGIASEVAVAEKQVWGTVWKDPLFQFDEMTAQQFSQFGEPSLILGNGFDSFGTHFCLAVSGDVLYSGNFYTIWMWDAETGADLGSLDVNSPLSNHIENYMQAMGVASNGDLLISGAGFSTELRTLTRYTVEGAWVRDYTAPDLMHTQGSPTANDDAVFIASRFNRTGTWDEQILMFTAGGSYVGKFGTELGGDVGDIEIQGETLYAMNYISGRIFEYRLNGSSLPTYLGSFALPSNVNPDAFALDRFAIYGDRFIVGDSKDYIWYEIDRNGNVHGAYEADVPMGAVWNFLGPVVVYDPGGGSTGPELNISGNCPGTTTFEVTGATAGGRVAFAYGLRAGATPVPPCPGLQLDFGGGALAEIVRADGNGRALLQRFVPAAACDRAMVQAVDLESCEKSNVVMP